MAVTQFTISRREPYGRFGEIDYERIEGIARCAVDPGTEANRDIVDLALAARDEDGLVPFASRVTVLRPVDPADASGRLLLEVPNRGRRTALGMFNRAPRPMEPTDEINPGDGLLFRDGYTVAMCAWQWDVPDTIDRLTFDAPIVVDRAGDGAPDSAGEPVAGWLQLRLLLDRHRTSVPLTDQHVGELGVHEPIPTADVDDPEARLMVRDRYWDEPKPIDRSAWRFDGADRVALDSGFEPGRIYDLVYRAARCPVVGTGLLAMRDVGSFLRRAGAGDGNPAAGLVDTVLGYGQSQCGRFLRTFLHLGLNAAEEGGPVFDGLIVHIAGGRRGEFNHRLGQPSVQPTPSFGHRFPFADDPQTDPATGAVDGLLVRQRERGHVPRIMFTDTGAEYWRGDASLAHTVLTAEGRAGLADAELPPEVRRYLLASTQHGPGLPQLTNETMFGVKAGNAVNVVDYTPLMRAALDNLAAWVIDGVEPPASAVPRIDDGTAVSRADALAALTGPGGPIADAAAPDTDALSTIRPLDLGPEEADGIGRYPAVPTGEPYPCVVAAVDEHGNEVAGLRMPDVEVPVATHTGWNPRHPDCGGTHLLLEYLGSTVPHDPAAVVERYDTEAAYLDLVRAAAERGVERRHLLADDVDLCVAIARKRWRAVVDR